MARIRIGMDADALHDRVARREGVEDATRGSQREVVVERRPGPVDAQQLDAAVGRRRVDRVCAVRRHVLDVRGVQEADLQQVPGVVVPGVVAHHVVQVAVLLRAAVRAHRYGSARVGARVAARVVEPHVVPELMRDHPRLDEAVHPRLGAGQLAEARPATARRLIREDVDDVLVARRVEAVRRRRGSLAALRYAVHVAGRGGGDVVRPVDATVGPDLAYQRHTPVRVLLIEGVRRVGIGEDTLAHVVRRPGQGRARRLHEDHRRLARARSHGRRVQKWVKGAHRTLVHDHRRSRRDARRPPERETRAAPAAHERVGGGGAIVPEVVGVTDLQLPGVRGRGGSRGRRRERESGEE